MSRLVATLFADFSCPYSYLTETALIRRAVSGGLEIRTRAFELFPPPTARPGPDEHFAALERVEPLASELGLEIRSPGFLPRTRKAHEAARFAAEHGVGEAMRSRIYSAFWSEGRDIGRIDVLTALIADLGVEPAELKIALDIDRFRDDVLRDEGLARQLRVPGIPTLFLGSGPGARVLVGLQPPSALDAELACAYEL